MKNRCWGNGVRKNIRNLGANNSVRPRVGRRNFKGQLAINKPIMFKDQQEDPRNWTARRVR